MASRGGSGGGQSQVKPKYSGYAGTAAKEADEPAEVPVESAAAPTHAGALDAVSSRSQRSADASGYDLHQQGRMSRFFIQKNSSNSQALDAVGSQDDHQQYDEEEHEHVEDAETLIREFGAHPMMDRVQQALYEQLMQTYERISEELRDKEADLKRMKGKRETVGVDLYSMQQQLARLQVSLEQTHNSYGQRSENRAKAELDLDTARETFAERKQATDELTRVHKKNRAELNALQETL
eukprot:10618-Heterococcus_DN1.PRE.1